MLHELHECALIHEKCERFGFNVRLLRTSLQRRTEEHAQTCALLTLGGDSQAHRIWLGMVTPGPPAMRLAA